ncbi:MAG TPA: dTDP-glucose 4,6-dehydratase [Clostridiales bacterium]|nr:MAG: dTDP-glucose 4,6-dehydratase [Clostridiales bacterium GWD2_32_59]HAN10432.1 dTDP-glucose 4,6-dehydratase [Clostridiales bacterium]
MKTILVTGGAGFIGNNFIKYMLNKYPKYKIINLDSLTYAGDEKNLSDVASNPNYHFIKGDITDSPLVDSIVKNGVSYIINFAAESHVDRSIESPLIFAMTNVVGTGVLLESARKYGVSKFIQISTDEVYGSLGLTGYFTEKSILAPSSPYSASKASADLLVLAYHRTYNLPVNITRCSNNYGPYQLPEKLIPLMICNAFMNKPLPVYGQGTNIRDWIHVEDHCRGIDLILNKGKNGEVYNIGSSNEISNIVIVKSILSILNRSESLIEHVEDRKGHDFRYAIDFTKIKTELGFEPKHEFNSGLRETVNWYLENVDWWRKKDQIYLATM